MLSYEKFETVINHIREQIDNEDKLVKAMQDILLDGHVVCKLSTTLFEDIISILEDMFLDKVETISWWIWESDFGTKHATIIDNHQQVNLISTKELYDYLYENYKKSLTSELSKMSENHKTNDPIALFDLINDVNGHQFK